MAGLLAGLKVLDFTYLLPGPFATMLLADMGAEVIKIESPDRIDLSRLVPPLVGEKEPISCAFAYLNRNKHSIALDLKTADGRAVVERLIAGGYDILIEQFRPGAMERLGLSFERLKEIEPRLIYCSLTGYGQTGPLSDRAGHDINYLALSGIMSYSGTQAEGPGVMGIQVADVGSGSNNAVIGILAAVIARMQTGTGQHIDVSMTDGMFPYHAVCGLQVLYGAQEPGYATEVLNGGSLYGFYATADGRYLSFGGLEPQFLAAFLQTLGLQEYLNGALMQPERLTEIRARVRAIIASQPLAHWVALFKDIDACVEPVLTVGEALDTPHVRERGLVVDVPTAERPLKQPAFPIKFSDFSPEYRHAGGTLGRDTLEVVRSLGFTPEEIDEMRTKGIFGESLNERG